MIRHETYRDGVCVEAEIVDVAAGTVTTEKHGAIVSVRPMTDTERMMLEASLNASAEDVL